MNEGNQMKYPKLIGFKETSAMTGLSTYEIQYLIEQGELTAVIPVKRKRKLIHQQVVDYMEQLYESSKRISG